MRYVEDFKSGMKTSLRGRYVFLTLGISLVFYMLVTLLSFPQYSIQLLGRDLFFLPTALTALTFNTLESSGWIGLSLTIVYSFLTGAAFSVITSSVNQKGIKNSKDIGAVIPGVVAAGCASCGVGVLALIGLGGSVALLPFQGNLIRLSAVLLLVAVITSNGDPEICSI